MELISVDRMAWRLWSIPKYLAPFGLMECWKMIERAPVPQPMSQMFFDFFRNCFFLEIIS